MRQGAPGDRRLEVWIDYTHALGFFRPVCSAAAFEALAFEKRIKLLHGLILANDTS
jgi:hypothetical protein